MSNIEHAINAVRERRDKPRTSCGDQMIDAMDDAYYQGMDHAIRMIETLCPELKEVKCPSS